MESCSAVRQSPGVRLKIVSVDAFGQVGTQAVFTGKAEVNGVVEWYRIDVDDSGEFKGIGGATFNIVTDTYATGGVVAGGNIQIH